MSADMADTDELYVVRAHRRAEPVRRGGGGPLRGLAGALAIGLLLVAAVLVAVEALAPRLEVRGPGPMAIVGHLVAGGLALGAAWVADHGRPVVAALGVLAAVGLTAVVLWVFWWA